MIMDYMDEDPFGLPPSARATSHQEKPPKQWDELRHEIKKTRRLAQNLTCRVPLNFTFRHLHTGAGELTRLYFLGMPQGYRENTLLYVDLPVEMRPESEVQEALEWKPLLDSFHSLATSGQFSKEEQLMRERRRVGGFGITSYDYNDMNGDFVFSACNSLYLVTDSIVYTAGTLEDHSRHATECRSSSPNSRLDAFMCPHNPKLLAYVSGGDLWVTNLFTGHEQRLTHTHTNEGGCRSNPVSAGVPSFVMQEEFDRYIGYWWQPSITQNNVYMILYEEVDESDVEILHLSSPTQDSDDEFRYPRAGSTNAMSSLKIVQFQLRRNGSFKDVVIKTMAEPITALFPDTEYIVHIGWHPSGESFHALLLNRRQQKLQLVLVQLSYMNPVSTEPMISDTMLSENVSHRVVPVAPVQILLEQSTSTWINTSDILHFLPSTTPGEISFIWSDERTGYRHLYLVNSSLARPVPLFDGEKPSKSTQSDQLQVNFVVEKALTMGDWAVSLKQINVDEENHLVYFTARKDTPLESHLYCVSYENPGVITRLTTLGYSHNVTLDIDCSMFVTMYSSIDQTQACEVYQINTSTETDVLCTAHPIATLLTHAATGVEEYKPPKLFEYKSDGGHTMHGMVYSPHNYKPNQQYPTVLYVYGGPQVQMVSNAYKGMRFLRLYTLAQLGYAVIVIDSRGSSGRGVEFESYIRDNMGHVEIQDQVDGLHWLAERVSYIDLNRVAIHGWSYGGFLSLMGLAQRPDVFKLAIAGAPVVSWNLYDTGYTERYMGLPHDNPQVYKRSSVLEYVERLPSLPNRLLIVHGLIDENVHFAHTLALISSLVKCVKPYQLQIFPNERHGIRISSEHYETTVLSFLQQNL